MVRRALGIVALIFPLVAFGDTDFRDLLLKAMVAKDGKAHAEVSGRLATMIRNQIDRPNARIVADVSTIGVLKQPGCKRFLIQFRTPGTLLALTDGTSRELDTGMKLNMCPNGQPPATSGSDLALPVSAAGS